MWEAGASDRASGVNFTLETRWIVNAAGLDAQAVAASMAGFRAAAIPRRHLAKGHYFSLRGRAPFSRLIYPMPTHGGLGVHLTLDLGGQAKFVPDVEWIDDVTFAADPCRDLDCTVDARRSDAFGAEVAATVRACTTARWHGPTAASGRS